MKTTTKGTNLTFCFVNGEPHLYDQVRRKYFKINIDYNEVFELVKNAAIKRSKRPSMREIWGMISDLIPCSNKFFSRHNINSVKNYNSFEARFSRDITIYLDKYFKRGYTDEEKLIVGENKKKKEKDIFNNYWVETIRRRTERKKRRN